MTDHPTTPAEPGPREPETEAGRHPDPLVQAWRDWQDRRDRGWDSYELIREAFAGGWDAARALEAERVEALREALEVIAGGRLIADGRWGWRTVRRIQDYAHDALILAAAPAVSRPEPSLDVERLARAMEAAEKQGVIGGLLGTDWQTDSGGHPTRRDFTNAPREVAEIVAREYAALGPSRREQEGSR